MWKHWKEKQRNIENIVKTSDTKVQNIAKIKDKKTLKRLSTSKLIKNKWENLKNTSPNKK